MAEKLDAFTVPTRKPVPGHTPVSQALPAPSASSAAHHGDQEPTHVQPGAQTSHKASYMALLERHMPASKRYLGLKRRTFLFVLLALVIGLLALIIGLAAGLTAGRSSKFLPLPSNKQSFDGDLTYYGTGLGACGVTSSDSDNIVSVSHFLFDHEQKGSDPNANPLCGRKIRATRFNEAAGGKRSVDLTVVDRCTGGQPTDLDVTISVFKKLANVDDGRVQVQWAWLGDEPS